VTDRSALGGYGYLTGPVLWGGSLPGTEGCVPGNPRCQAAAAAENKIIPSRRATANPSQMRGYKRYRTYAKARRVRVHRRSKAHPPARATDVPPAAPRSSSNAYGQQRSRRAGAPSDPEAFGPAV